MHCKRLIKVLQLNIKNSSETTNLINLTSLFSHHVMTKQCRYEDMNSAFTLTTESLEIPNSSTNTLEKAITLLDFIQKATIANIICFGSVLVSDSHPFFFLSFLLLVTFYSLQACSIFLFISFCSFFISLFISFVIFLFYLFVYKH